MLFKKIPDTSKPRDFRIDLSKKMRGNLTTGKYKGLNRSTDRLDKWDTLVPTMNLTSRGFSTGKIAPQPASITDMKLRTINSDRMLVLERLKRNRFMQQDRLEKKNQSKFNMCNIRIVEKEALNQRSTARGFTLIRRNFMQEKENQISLVSVEVSTMGLLIDQLKDKIGSLGPRHFETSPRNIVLDFCLTQPSISGSFMNGSDLTVVPLYNTPQKRIRLTSFEIIKCIGTGGFAKVYLSRFKEDQLFYAMKVVEKEELLRKKKQNILLNELEVMKTIRGHPFVVDLKFAFETSNYVVLITEFCPGSQFFSLIKKLRRMKEEQARFYAIEILLGLEHIHSHRVLYRDIKPENILLDIHGHIKITDFGLSKPVGQKTKNKAYSFCGSPEYMSPEIILKKGHSFASDFYSFGALLHEMLTGLPPFYCEDSNKIYESTLTEQLKFPQGLSQEVISLMSGLLQKDERYRLGSLSGVKQILAHPWFGKINRQEYLSKMKIPPVAFNSADKIDLSFKEFQEENKKIEFIMKEPDIVKKKLPNFYFDYRIFDGLEPDLQGIDKRELRMSRKKTESIQQSKENRNSETRSQKLLRRRQLTPHKKIINQNLIRQIKKAFLPQTHLNTANMACEIMNLDKLHFS